MVKIIFFTPKFLTFSSRFAYAFTHSFTLPHQPNTHPIKTTSRTHSHSKTPPCRPTHSTLHLADLHTTQAPTLRPSPHRPTLCHSTLPTLHATPLHRPYTPPLHPSPHRPTPTYTPPHLSEPFYPSYFTYYYYIQNLLYLKIYPIYLV